MINGVQFNRYKATLQGVKNLYGGSKEILQGGSKKTLHNKDIIDNDLDKDIKKERKTYDAIIQESGFNETVQQSLYEFIKMRKLIKAPMTDRALKGIFNELDKLGHNDKEKIAILEQSIVRSWRGVFAISKPKQEEKQGTNSDDVWDLNDMPSIV
jgi:hypothetical protein